MGAGAVSARCKWCGREDVPSAKPGTPGQCGASHGDYESLFECRVESVRLRDDVIRVLEQQLADAKNDDLCMGVRR